MTYRHPMRHDQIALQLYTVRTLAANDLPGTLRAVAAAGYRSVELAGLPEIAPGELARLLEEAGLRAVAAHEGIEGLRRDAGAVADRLTEVGCPRVIVPWMPEEDRRTADGVRHFAAELGRLAETFARRDIRLGYHNHSFEFEPLDGTTVWDVMRAELPPEVELELDLYWAVVGGRDPVAEIQATADRVRLLHMKDRAPGPEPHDAPAGEGTLPFPEIVAAARAAGVEWYIAEQDEPHDPLDDVARAFRYLESLAV
jgi:sugar phosphate isomerase/epimerase